ncbi:MAG: molybdopterin cofactor-binding domain-containing protein [Phycisphaerae bacterium]
MSGMVEISRRGFLQGLGAGILIVVAAPVRGQEERERGERRARGGGRTDVAARVHISKAGVITVMTGKVECGQGARAEITQAAAEELAVSPGKIQLIMGNTELCPDDGGTYGSRTTPATLPSVRKGCAAAREMLIAAACAKWGVEDRAGVELRDGAIREPVSRREVTYGDLVGEDAEKFFGAEMPKGVGLTKVSDWEVMGKPFARSDARELVTGGHVYPTDIVREGMGYGAMLRPPSYGAKLKKIDMGVVEGMNRVKAYREGEFVGVVARSSYAARKGIEALEKSATWVERANAVSSAELYGHLKKTARNVPENAWAEEAGGKNGVKAEYHVAYVQHAPMEPRVGVAEWNGGKLTVWTGTQNPWGVRGELMKAFSLRPEEVRVIVPDFGGGFGGKHSGEAAVEAARLSKLAGKPVKVRWTREEEFMWAYFRPAGVIRAEGSADGEGKLASWYFVNINSGPAGLATPYEVGKKKEQAVGADGPLRAGSYRGLAATANHFARECFVDELALAAGKDPLAFRLANLKDERVIAVLKRAAEKFGWGSKRERASAPPYRGVGLACGTEKGSYVAACVEVSVDEKHVITVERVVQAFECGKIVNPTGLMSQVQGAIVMGLGAALREEVKFEKGAVVNGNFADYEVPRFGDLPKIFEIELMDRPDLPSAGAGETPIVAVAPAIANAVFAATGKRVRQMPVRLEA